MGDRGATATEAGKGSVKEDCSRWEIGEQPQRNHLCNLLQLIVADGRSGSNRNTGVAGAVSDEL